MCSDNLFDVDMLVIRPATSSMHYLECLRSACTVPNSKLVRMSGLVRVGVPYSRGLFFADLVGYREADSGAVMVTKEQAQYQFPQVTFNSYKGALNVCI